MLLVGTGNGLLDLDTGDMLVDGQAVTGLASGAGGWHVMLDRKRVFAVLAVDRARSTAAPSSATRDGIILA